MKTFELTQEQIDRLAEKKHAKELLQQFIPEAFETKLEVGKWYKFYHDCDENTIIALIFISDVKGDLVYFNYRFDFRYKDEWIFNRDWFSRRHIWILATEEEVREVLINEAKKRGYKEGVKCKFGIIEEIRTIETNDFVFKLEYNTLGIKLKNGNADVIFRSGKWSEIIEETEPTKEEINRVLTFLKNQNEQ